MNKAQQLMSARMGMYRSGESDVGGLPALLTHQGGFPQQNRMIKDKFRSFKKALDASYQGAFITAFGKEAPKDSVKALINPNKLKQDYDDKIISVSYEYGFEPGSIFKWENTGTYWLIYLQDLEELAYFRGDIRKCNYTIKWKDESQEEHETYIAVRGPVETRIESIQKKNISVDVPNHSLNILMPKNEFTISYFKRYAEFYLQEDQSICWRVEATDSISMPGVLEINAVEYYKNDQEDSDGIVNNQILKPLDNDDKSDIHGEIAIKPKKEYMYVTDQEITKWEIKEKKLPIKLSVIDGDTAVVQWTANYGGEFTLMADDFEKRITVESLF